MKKRYSSFFLLNEADEEEIESTEEESSTDTNSTEEPEDDNSTEEEDTSEDEEDTEEPPESEFDEEDDTEEPPSEDESYDSGGDEDSDLKLEPDDKKMKMDSLNNFENLSNRYDELNSIIDENLENVDSLDVSETEKKFFSDNVDFIKDMIEEDIKKIKYIRSTAILNMDNDKVKTVFIALESKLLSIIEIYTKIHDKVFTDDTI